MKREIYQVNAIVIDANGTFNNLSGYPKVFDSKQNNNDLEKTYARAKSDWHEVLGAMNKIDTRKLQEAWIIRISDNALMNVEIIGSMPDEPDPVPEVVVGE